MKDPGLETTYEWVAGHTSPDSDAGDDDLGIPDNPLGQSSSAPTSRSSLNKFYNIIHTFNEFKKGLVRSIGFGGMLDLPRITKLNIKFSMWLLQRVDCQEFCLRLSGDRSIRLNPEDVSLIFGVPCGEKDLLGPDAYVSQHAIECMQISIGFTDENGHKLKSLEDMLRLELDEETPAPMVEAFKIAFVVYAMGKVLTPSSKHDYLNVTFWGALVHTDEIKNFNWAAHVFNAIIGAARKVQSDIVRKGTVSNISGCHLFLQVLYLDNLDLGPLKKSQDKLPRIMDFSSDNLSRMIAANSCRCPNTGETLFGITQKFRQPNEVRYKCFGGAQQLHVPPEQPPVAQDQMHASSPSHTPFPQGTTSGKFSAHRELPIYAASPSGADQKKLLNLIRQEYPQLERSKIADELKRFNAAYINLTMNYRCLVTDHILAFSRYVLHCTVTGEGKEELAGALFASPLTYAASVSGHSNAPRGSGRNFIQGQKLDMSEHEAESEPAPAATEAHSADALSKRSIHTSVSTGQKKQRSCSSAGDAVRGHQPSSTLDIARSRFAKGPRSFTDAVPDDVLLTLRKDYQLMVLNQMCAADEVERSDGKVLYGHRCIDPVSKSKVKLDEKSRSPWNMGCMHPLNDPAVTQKVYAASDVYLRRIWIIHEVPKYIQLNGDSFKSHLVESKPMSVEMCDILIRRLMQLDSQMHANAWKCRWRHWLESDFYGFTVAGYNVLDIQSIWDQFIGTDVPYNLAACRMIMVPACVSQAWCCFTFDMWNQVIYVLDPLGPSANTAMKVNIAHMLQQALIQCIYSFFENWKPSDNQWEVKSLISTHAMLWTLGFACSTVHGISMDRTWSSHLDGARLHLFAMLYFVKL